MDLLLVQPAVSKKVEFLESSHRTLQPLTPAIIAALTPEGVEVRFLDDRLEEVSYQPAPDLVGITVTTYTAHRSYQIADRFRAVGAKVVLGGHHPTLRPEEASQHASSVIVGEAEGLWKDVLSDFHRDNLKERYQLPEKPDLNSIPRPDRSIFQGKNYLPVKMVETTRGCPHNCSFCSVSSFFGRGYRHRPIEAVVEEVNDLDGRLVFFVDDNIVGDFNYAKSLFRELRGSKTRWFGQTDISMARDEELLKLMKQSGCVGTLIGFESLDDENLKAINKSWNKNLSYDEAVDRIHNKGLTIYGSFITGLDGDTPETVDRIYEFALRKKFLAANFNVLTPYPGTRLYREFQEEGRLLYDKWWLEGRFSEVRFEPKNFEPEELLLKSAQVKWNYYKYRNILGRASNWRPNFSSPYNSLIFFVMNKALHDEQAKRQRELPDD